MKTQINPVMGRELKIRVRGWRSVIMLTIYLVLVLLTVWIAYEGVRPNQFDSFDATRAAGSGRTLFGWIVSLIVVLLGFLVPGMVAGSIAGERERQTMVPLQVTLMRPRAIVGGKVAAAVSWVVLMVVATIPLLTVCFLIGGVTVSDVLRAVVAVLALTVWLAAVAVMCSAVFRRVQWAMLVTYAAIALCMVGTFAAYGAIAAFQAAGAQNGADEINPPEIVLTLNPLVAMGDFLGDPDQGDTPFDGLASVAHNNRGIGPDGDGDSGRFRILGLDYWVFSTLLLGAMAAGCLGVATRRVRAPAEVER